MNTNVRSSLRRTAGEAGAAEGEEDIVDATIVSHHFWPPLQDDDLQVCMFVQRNPSYLIFGASVLCIT